MTNGVYQRVFCALAAVALPWAARAQAPQYIITTVVGNGTAGYFGNLGPAKQAEINGPCKLAFDTSGNLYFADEGNYVIREVATNGTITTVIGDGVENYYGDGGPPLQAEILQTCGVTVDSAGDIYFAQENSADPSIREAAKGGNVSTIAGSAPVSGTPVAAGYGGDGGPATSALVNAPYAMALDTAGNLYFADSGNNRIRVIGTNGIINTVAGNGNAGFSGDGGQALQADLHTPDGVALDAAGNLYIADTLNHRIRKVTRSTGVITTIAGTTTNGYSKADDGGPAAKAQLNYPKDVAVDESGNVYVVDSWNLRIRMITPGGTIYTIAGSGSYSNAGDGGPATSAGFNFPLGIALGPNGAIYISDTGNNEIRMLTPVPAVNGTLSVGSCGAFSSASPGAWVEIYGTNLATATHLWTTSDFIGNTAPTSLAGTSVTIGGQNAVVSYVGSGQVNAQVPLSVPTGSQSLVVKDVNGSTAAYALTVNATQPGLCQGANLNGTQYVAAAFADVSNGVTYVLPSSANIGAPVRPAHAGDVITLFGNGFGPVTPSPAQGQVVQQLNNLTNQLQILFGQTPASAIQYAGLAPDAIGLYQFNVVVPSVPASNAVPITFTLGGVAGTQPQLYTAVQ